MAETALNRNEDRLDKELQFEFEDRRRGMWLGFSALMAFLLSGLFVLWLGYPNIGATLLGAAAIGTVVLGFVNGRGRSMPTDDVSDQSADPAEPAKLNLWRRILDLFSRS